MRCSNGAHHYVALQVAGLAVGLLIIGAVVGAAVTGVVTKKQVAKMSAGSTRPTTSVYKSEDAPPSM